MGLAVASLGKALGEEEVTVEAWRLAPFNVKVRLAQHFRLYLMGALSEAQVQIPPTWLVLLLSGILKPEAMG